MDAQNPQQQVVTSKVAMVPNADFNKWAESLSEELALMEHDLRGEKLVQKDEGFVWEQAGDELINEKGIRFIIGELRGFANKNTFLSNTDRERIFEICKWTALAFTESLFSNGKKFDLRAENFSVLVEKYNNFIEFAARRPMDEGERKMVSQTTNETRVIAERPNDSAFGRIPFMGKQHK